MVTLEEAKKFLGLSEKSVEKDALVTALITISLKVIETYTGLTFAEEEDASKTFDGTGETFLELPATLQALTSVEIGGEEVTGCYVSDGYLVGATFTEGSQNIIVTGTWGYNDTNWPQDLWLAQQMILTWLFQQNKEEIAVASRNYQSSSTIMVKSIPLPALIILDAWKVRAL